MYVYRCVAYSTVWSVSTSETRTGVGEEPPVVLTSHSWSTNTRSRRRRFSRPARWLDALPRRSSSTPAAACSTTTTQGPRLAQRPASKVTLNACFAAKISLLFRFGLYLNAFVNLVHFNEIKFKTTVPEGLRVMKFRYIRRM